MKFIKKDINKKARLKKNWRKPKGITNKKRLNRKGHTANVRPGYGTKKTGRHMVKGLTAVTITKIEELKNINPKTQGIIITKMGRRKKNELLKKAEELKIKIINFNKKQYEETTKKLEQKRKEEKKTKEEKNKKKQEETKKAEKKPEVEEKTEELTPEEKKKQEKEERDKVITKGM